MSNQIEAVLFDMGGTLRRTTRKSRDEKREAILRIMNLTGVDQALGVDEFFGLLTKRAKAYKRWAEETLIELKESDLWTQWMLPDYPADVVGKHALELNQAYRDATGTRVVFPEAREVALELFRRGYRLGLVSNTTSSVEVPAAFKELNLSGCFEVVILSAVVGKRKPDPAILLEAVERMSVQPKNCAYIGDRPDRDVAAARRAGFSKTIIVRNAAKPRTGYDPSLLPDHFIENLKELLAIFPGRKPVRPGRTHRASLSTMWAMKNFPTLADFFEFTRRDGFAQIELNHKVNSAMLAGIDLSQFSFSSVHAPCPADITDDELKKRDWLISSTNEAYRCEGVNSVKRSIDLATRIGAPVVVIHAGHVHGDTGLEKKLRALLASGQQESPAFHEIQAQMIKFRSETAGPAFEAVRRSMLELLDYAAGKGVCLGVENRYHYYECPSPDELDALLGLAGPDRLGFVYDVGHDQTLFRLGFYPQNAWLERFGTRIVGTHLHDVIGTTDHYAPGLGEVDFDRVAAYLPEKAFRTCEFQEFNTPEQLRSGLRFLADHGCIKIR